MSISLSLFAPENLVSRDGFGSPVPRQPAHLHTQTEYGAYSRDSSRFPRRGVHLSIPPSATGSVPSLSGYAIAHRWRSLPRVRRHRASSPQDSSSNGCCFSGITIDRFLYALISHTHYKHTRSPPWFSW